MFPPITKNAKEQITTTNPYSNPYLMSGSSLFLFAVFYRPSDGSLKRKSNSFFIVFFTFCVTIYLCLLTATLLPFTFILFSLLHSFPFVLSKILVRFLFVLQADVWFPPAVSECAVPCIHFSRTKMRSVCLFNFVRLHRSTYTFFFFFWLGLTEVWTTKSSGDGSSIEQSWHTVTERVNFHRTGPHAYSNHYYQSQS